MTNRTQKADVSSVTVASWRRHGTTPHDGWHTIQYQCTIHLCILQPREM